MTNKLPYYNVSPLSIYSPTETGIFYSQYTRLGDRYKPIPNNKLRLTRKLGKLNLLGLIKECGINATFPGLISIILSLS